MLVARRAAAREHRRMGNTLPILIVAVQLGLKFRCTACGSRTTDSVMTGKSVGVQPWRAEQALPRTGFIGSYRQPSPAGRLARSFRTDATMNALQPWRSLRSWLAGCQSQMTWAECQALLPWSWPPVGQLPRDDKPRRSYNKERAARFPDYAARVGRCCACRVQREHGGVQRST